MSESIKKLRRFLYEYRREGLIFLLLFLELLRTLPDAIYDWCNAFFVVDYSLGFDSRLLIGSVLKLFYPEYLPARSVYHFVLLSLIVLLLLVSCLLGYALRRLQKTSAGTGLLLLVVLYLACPGSPAYLWSTENMGRLDLYLLILTLLGGILYLKVSSVTVRLIAFTVTGLLAICVHQAFIFVFFPLLFLMFIDTMTEYGTKKKHFILGIAGLVLLVAAAAYFQFFSHINATSPEALVSSLSARTDMAIGDSPLRLEYFSDFAASTLSVISAEAGERIRYGIITVFLLLPLAFIYGYLWKTIAHILRKGVGGSISVSFPEKFKYWMILLSQLAFVPVFLLTLDWGRWFGAFLTVQAMQIIFLAAKKDAVVLSALSSLGTTLRRHPYPFLVLILYLASMHKFEAVLLPDAPAFFSSVYRFYDMLFH